MSATVFPRLDWALSQAERSLLFHGRTQQLRHTSVVYSFPLYFRYMVATFLCCSSIMGTLQGCSCMLTRPYNYLEHDYLLMTSQRTSGRIVKGYDHWVFWASSKTGGERGIELSTRAQSEGAFAVILHSLHSFIFVFKLRLHTKTRRSSTVNSALCSSWPIPIQKNATWHFRCSCSISLHAWGIASTGRHSLSLFWAAEMNLCQSRSAQTPFSQRGQARISQKVPSFYLIYL